MDNTPLKDLVPSLIRTYTPTIVGALFAWLLTLGVNVDSGAQSLLIAALTAILTSVYYTLARLAERKFPGVGKILLLSSRVPVSAKPDNVVQLTAAKNAIEKNEAA